MGFGVEFGKLTHKVDYIGRDLKEFKKDLKDFKKDMVNFRDNQREFNYWVRGQFNSLDCRRKSNQY